MSKVKEIIIKENGELILTPRGMSFMDNRYADWKVISSGINYQVEFDLLTRGVPELVANRLDAKTIDSVEITILYDDFDKQHFFYRFNESELFYRILNTMVPNHYPRPRFLDRFFIKEAILDKEEIEKIKQDLKPITAMYLSDSFLNKNQGELSFIMGMKNYSIPENTNLTYFDIKEIIDPSLKEFYDVDGDLETILDSNLKEYIVLDMGQGKLLLEKLFFLKYLDQIYVSDYKLRYFRYQNFLTNHKF